MLSAALQAVGSFGYRLAGVQHLRFIRQLVPLWLGQFCLQLTDRERVDGLRRLVRQVSPRPGHCAQNGNRCDSA